MEIGEYITQNQDELLAWGNSVAREIEARHGASLKMPPSVRLKDIDSARRKQLKKNYSNPCVEMTDLVGARFVVLTSDDVNPLLTSIRESEIWSHKQTRDPETEALESPSTFGYQSHHYELRPEAGGPCCEVQVRTLLQHTIAELSHDALYKSAVEAPSQATRLVARSIALMETTDELLVRAMQSVRARQQPFEALKRELISHSGQLSAGRPELFDDLFEAYGSKVSFESISDFQGFMREHQFIVERIAGRLDRGIFSFPASAIFVYWFVKRFERVAKTGWPYPGSVEDLKLIFSDLGKAY